MIDAADNGDRPRPGAAAGNFASLPLGRRILVVEDNYLVALDFEDSLIASGYDVVAVVASASEAIEACLAAPPDFALMDIRLLGNVDGITAAIEIRKRFGVRSVFVTAHDDPPLLERARAAEPLGWILKPISGARLVERLGVVAQSKP